MLDTSIFSFSHNTFYPYKIHIHVLILYHTITTFNDPTQKPLENIVAKGENVFYHSQNKCQVFSNLILSSANAFNLNQSKILSFGKGLSHLQLNACRFSLDEFKMLSSGKELPFTEFVLSRIENIQKRRKCCLPVFSLFSHNVSKGFGLGVVITQHCLLTHYKMTKFSTGPN